ncbi:MAG: thrombospondin type 3 repeat-containing protein [Saprospiraceae bacterium]|nr:thrombospondin type 3 repeat-containing protein [Candidatus Vicinibacter affinis]
MQTETAFPIWMTNARICRVVENMGCPSDRDKDGVYDVDDLCPDLVEPWKGCPDSDKDGVADKDDKCPQIAGTLMGCPDSDRDGIADKDDKCPNEPGPASKLVVRMTAIKTEWKTLKIHVLIRPANSMVARIPMVMDSQTI